ncbi:PAS domain-containing sensor histidine kinase [Halorussus halobius]|uniref:PAS domain-containing sensor histidine kinase n=1 Tax=Halorussus halobius TaxID=1710537 RepID=UPI001092BFD9|nr:PAS domain S-box protein [Halorussus halobius]
MDSRPTEVVETLATLDRLCAECEPITASDLADEFGCSRGVAAERLDRLADRGELKCKRVDSASGRTDEGARVWWRPPDAGDLDRARFRSLVEAVDEYAIFMLDPEGRVVTWNEGASRIKGYDAEEIIGRHFSAFYADGDVADGRPERNLAAAREQGHVEDEGWRVRADGTEFWANVLITAIRDDDGALQGFAKVTRDMTERREHEQQLRRERDQTAQILATSPIPMSVRDAEGDVVMANERMQALLELSEAELHDDAEAIAEVDVFDPDGEPVGPDELPAREVAATGEPVSDVSLVVEQSDGDRRWLSMDSTPVFGPDGDLERIVTAAEDVTELKQRERELETELGEILGRISDAFYALDEEYRFTHVNGRAAELLQRSEAELLGENLWDVFPEAAELQPVRDSFRTAMETQEPTSYEVYFDVLDIWVEANVYPSETGVSVYFRDVSERIERERDLRESERRHRTLAENFPDGIVTLFDDDLRYTLAAGEAFDRVDVAPEDLEGRTPRQVWNDEETAEALDAACRAAIDGEHESVEVEYADREWIIYAVPIADESGDVFAGMTMALDITERKERERRLERFASVISHGLRNPLEIAQIYLNMARDDGDADDFEQVEQALDRMETIIQNLLATTVEGKTASHSEPVSLSSVSRDAWRNVESRNATLDVAEDAGAVVADDEQLQTALENLFRNTVEHGGEDVTVRVGRLDDAESDSRAGFFVADDGPGIPPADREAVFEYGFTSRSGTGIGLAVVRDVVDAHDWRISVTDGREGGARFEVRGVEDGREGGPGEQ